MNFFFDRNVSYRFAHMLDVYEENHHVRHLDDDPRFTTTTLDIDWIPILGRDEAIWAIVSADRKIYQRRTERAVLFATDLKFFCLSPPWLHMGLHMGLHDQAWRLVKIWPEIVDAALRSQRRVFEITAGRSVRMTAVE